MDYSDSAEGSNTIENHIDTGEKKEYGASSSTRQKPAPLRSRSSATSASAAPSSRFEIFRQKTRDLMHPPHKLGEAPSPMESIKAIITSSCAFSSALGMNF